MMHWGPKRLCPISLHRERTGCKTVDTFFKCFKSGSLSEFAAFCLECLESLEEPRDYINLEGVKPEVSRRCLRRFLVPMLNGLHNMEDPDIFKPGKAFCFQYANEQLSKE